MTSTQETNPFYVRNDERIAIVGAGVAGIATAAALNSAGYTNIVVYDKHDTMGGLWVENYPNASGMYYFLT
jgi:cation diffusion facilitator CzcD-associated flavoprotein CzcO